MGNINPQEFHDGAYHSVGAEEEEKVDNRKEPIKPVVERLQEPPEELGDECSSEVGSDLMDGIPVGQLGVDTVDRVPSRSDPMPQALEDERDASRRRKSRWIRMNRSSMCRG